MYQRQLSHSLPNTYTIFTNQNYFQNQQFQHPPFYPYQITLQFPYPNNSHQENLTQKKKKSNQQQQQQQEQEQQSTRKLRQSTNNLNDRKSQNNQNRMNGQLPFDMANSDQINRNKRFLILPRFPSEIVPQLNSNKFIQRQPFNTHEKKSFQKRPCYFHNNALKTRPIPIESSCSSNNPYEQFCYKCEQRGHLPRHCPQKHQFTYFQFDQEQEQEQKQKQEQEQEKELTSEKIIQEMDVPAFVRVFCANCGMIGHYLEECRCPRFEDLLQRFLPIYNENDQKQKQFRKEKKVLLGLNSERNGTSGIESNTNKEEKVDLALKTDQSIKFGKKSTFQTNRCVRKEQLTNKENKKICYQPWIPYQLQLKRKKVFEQEQEQEHKRFRTRYFRYQPNYSNSNNNNNHNNRYSYNNDYVNNNNNNYNKHSNKNNNNNNNNFNRNNNKQKNKNNNNFRNTQFRSRSQERSFNRNPQDRFSNHLHFQNNLHYRNYNKNKNNHNNNYIKKLHKRQTFNNHHNTFHFNHNQNQNKSQTHSKYHNRSHVHHQNFEPRTRSETRELKIMHIKNHPNSNLKHPNSQYSNQLMASDVKPNINNSNINKTTKKNNSNPTNINTKKHQQTENGFGNKREKNQNNKLNKITNDNIKTGKRRRRQKKNQKKKKNNKNDLKKNEITEKKFEKLKKSKPESTHYWFPVVIEKLNQQLDQLKILEKRNKENLQKYR
ncbi:hypothetical protein M0812_07998 [Anaeramoeba flamelloides]|uniref:CCHC-type domain-containing protein n=1 Tax=Anaeramoeba flamelloides TaxID=1746091 RepID=A0AAV7ZZK2_9EUKA|nr:hypothetical protein M0812_07998 [Anaeramoeba flamelloides]